MSGETRAKDAGSARPRLAILEGIRPYDRRWLPGDVLAGVTLAALGIPEVMGYTKISGTPVITGLYTLLLPVVVFAILGSSRHLVVGGDSATAAILAAGIGGLGLAGVRPRQPGVARPRRTERPDRAARSCSSPGCSASASSRTSSRGRCSSGS